MSSLIGILFQVDSNVKNARDARLESSSHPNQVLEVVLVLGRVLQKMGVQSPQKQELLAPLDVYWVSDGRLRNVCAAFSLTH